jgi:hypothetical protein
MGKYKLTKKEIEKIIGYKVIDKSINTILGELQQDNAKKRRKK